MCATVHPSVHVMHLHTFMRTHVCTRTHALKRIACARALASARACVEMRIRSIGRFRAWRRPKAARCMFTLYVLHVARCMLRTLHVARCTEFARQIRGRGGGKGKGKGRGGGKNSRVGEEARIKKHPTFKGYAQLVGSTCEQLLRYGAGASARARRWLRGNKLSLR